MARSRAVTHAVCKSQYPDSCLVDQLRNIEAVYFGPLSPGGPQAGVQGCAMLGVVDVFTVKQRRNARF